MIERWAISIVISFILRQLAKFQKTIDWAKVKADLKPRIEQLVPGTWFDDEVVAICNLVLDRAAEVLAQGDAIEIILKLLADAKWQEAAAALKDLLLGGFVPHPKNTVKAGAKVQAALSQASGSVNPGDALDPNYGMQEQPDGVGPWEPKGARMAKSANGIIAQGNSLGDRAWHAVKAV